jgi:hypothetical protein
MASGSYNVTTLAQLQPTLSAVSGNSQTGLPGSSLATPLVAALRDNGGNPMPGVPIAFTVSAGASEQVSAVTDANGVITAVSDCPQQVASRPSAHLHNRIQFSTFLRSRRRMPTED